MFNIEKKSIYSTCFLWFVSMFLNIKDLFTIQKRTWFASYLKLQINLLQATHQTEENYFSRFSLSTFSRFNGCIVLVVLALLWFVLFVTLYWQISILVIFYYQCAYSKSRSSLWSKGLVFKIMLFLGLFCDIFIFPFTFIYVTLLS